MLKDSVGHLSRRLLLRHTVQRLASIVIAFFCWVLPPPFVLYPENQWEHQGLYCATHSYDQVPEVSRSASFLQIIFGGTSNSPMNFVVLYQLSLGCLSSLSLKRYAYATEVSLKHDDFNQMKQLTLLKVGRTAPHATRWVAINQTEQDVSSRKSLTFTFFCAHLSGASAKRITIAYLHVN